MAVGEDAMSKMEQRRIELEGNIAKLRASLLHWQAWEIEYEGMKEEILNLGDEPSIAEINETADSNDEISVDSDRTLLTRKEKLSIVKDERGTTRKPQQIVDRLSRRIDYVQQNTKTLGSLLEAAQKDLLALEVVTEAKAVNEEGLPLIDILEELDEDGNVISSSTSVPGETVPKAVEAIEKAAGRKVGERSVKATGSTESSKPNHVTAISKDYFSTQTVPNDSRSVKGSDPPQTSNILKKSETVGDSVLVESPAPTQKADSSKSLKSTEKIRPSKRPESPKKRVSFIEDEEESASEIARSHKASEQRLLQEILDREADELERREMAESIIPDDESPEDALLRRQMIQYNMEEVGAVVAEIDLEDDALSGSEYDSDIIMEDVDDDGADMEDEEEGEEEGEEDAFGRTTSPKHLDTAYVKRMQALSDKLKASAMINIGPNESVGPREVIGNQPSKSPKKSQKSASSGKKGVRFADDLDIQESPGKLPEVSNQVDEDPDLSVANLLAASSVISGKPIAQMADPQRVQETKPPTDTKPKNPSKFKAARAQASFNAGIAASFNSTPKPKEALEPIGQKILADTLIERPYTASAPAPRSPTNPDTDLLDPELLQSEVSTAYHHLRNRQIHREGGFLRNDDDDDSRNQEEIPYEEPSQDTNGDGATPKKKISRFKAARLGMQ